MQRYKTCLVDYLMLRWNMEYTQGCKSRHLQFIGSIQNSPNLTIANQRLLSNVHVNPKMSQKNREILQIFKTSDPRCLEIYNELIKIQEITYLATVNMTPIATRKHLAISLILQRLFKKIADDKIGLQENKKEIIDMCLYVIKSR